MNDPFQEGQYIEDQYLLIRWLGMGGYGEVWLARDISMRDTEENHDVAIKIVDVSGMSDKEIERAQRECEFGIKLDIPGVVKVIRTIYNDKVSQFFIIMRLMQGDLAEQIYSDTPISFAQALKWAIDLCDTLERVHNRRVIHRDIKPQNILLDSKDHVYFCDFGIARITTESLLSSSTTNVTSSSTTASALSARVGSPDYKAPEVKAGHKAYFASDVYSLCAVFFELWLVTRYSIYEDTDRILLRKEFLRRLQKKYVNTPPICREKLADAILQGLLPIRKQRVRLVELRKALREVQQCLNSTEKLTPVPMPIIEEKSNTDHVLAEEACPIIQRGNKLPLAVFPSSPFLEDQKPIEEVLPKTYREHAEEVNVVAWSPDARCLGSAGSAIYVRRATDEGRNIPYRDHSHKITAMVWSPDSRYIASVSTGSESIINIWDTVNKMTMVTYTTNIGYIMALKWFASELYVALVNTDGIHIWNADTKQHIASYKGHMKLVRAVTWSPDGQFIASASSDKTIRVWNASTGSELCTCTTQAAAVDLIAWSPNGQYLASAGIDQTVQIWDATTGKNIFTYYGHSYAIYALAWSPDSKCIASASGDRTVQVWNALTGDNVFVYQGHSHEVLSLAWSPDGTRIASAGRDRTVQVWASPAQTRVFTYRDSHAQLDTLVWLPKEDTEQRIATGHKDGTIHVYSVPPGREEFTYQLHSAEITSLTRSPDGQFIASASKDGTVQMWHLTRKQKKRIYSHHSNEVYTVAWSPNGKYIAFAGTDRLIQVWDVAKERKFSTYEHHSNDVYSLAWSPDGKRIASASKDKTLQVWDSGRGGRVYINQNLPHEVYAVAWSPNGQYIASAGKSRFVQVWNAATWSAVSIYDESPFSAVYAVAWSPNGQYIASASYGTVQVWNAFTKETLLTHHLHLGEVNALAWSPDGLYVASVGNDRTLRVWQMN